MIMKRILQAFFLSLIMLSCKKDNPAPQCESLRAAMQSDNVNAATAAVTQYIRSLSSQDYSRENLENLSSAIAGHCAIRAELLCFSCIDTYPEQSEIKVSIIYQGTSLSKIFDISYTPDNKIKVVNMHD